MTKGKYLLVFFMMIMLIFTLPNIGNATEETTDGATGETTETVPEDNIKIMKSKNEENIWIKFPTSLSKSWMPNWDGYYVYSGSLENISTSENVTFQKQYFEIEQEYIDEIQEKSDQTLNDEEFYSWLDKHISKYINVQNWSELTKMNLSIECKLGEDIEHDHLAFVKVLVDNAEYIVWEGYGAGFGRVSESRKNVTLESIEITTPPSKTDYEEGESFDITDMVISAKYSNGSSKVVTNYTYAPQTALKISDTAITITYTEGDVSKEVIQEINVKEKKSEDVGNNTTGDEDEKDETVVTEKIPNAGVEVGVVVAILAVIIAGIVIYSKYNKMKDIL